MYNNTSSTERFFLIGVVTFGNDRKEEEFSLAELEQLVYSAGGVVVGKELVTLRHFTPAYLLTKGKAEQFTQQLRALEATGVVFNNELSPAQLRNLEEMFSLKVIDRTTLILDIFARNAHTREGKLQVELAQLSYLLPRLRGRGAELSRLAGGIGTRGPGETKLETDRRKIKERIHALKKAINRVRSYRETQRKKRLTTGLPLVAIIGYTNTGKSTLLNRLTHADALVEDKLFATLDTTVRRLMLQNGIEVLISDTVGFINKLPTTLIAAFRATLEETTYAHLLLHVVDASQPRPERQIESTTEILSELHLNEKPMIIVFNKVDLVKDRVLLNRLIERYQPAIAISARTGEGINELMSLISAKISEIFRLVTLEIPYDESARLHRVLPQKGHNISLEYLPDCIKAHVRLFKEDLQQIPSHWLKHPSPAR